MTIKLVDPPGYFFDLFVNLPPDLDQQDDPGILKDLIHLFTKDAGELEFHLRALKNELKQDGMIWVSWPKKSSKVQTGTTEDLVREHAINNGLVDIV